MEYNVKIIVIAGDNCIFEPIDKAFGLLDFM